MLPLLHHPFSSYISYCFSLCKSSQIFFSGFSQSLNMLTHPNLFYILSFPHVSQQHYSFLHTIGLFSIVNLVSPIKNVIIFLVFNFIYRSFHPNSKNWDKKGQTCTEKIKKFTNKQIIQFRFSFYINTNKPKEPMKT